MMHSPGTLLIIAPHADDETLGAGGTLLRLRQEGWKLHWLLISNGQPSQAPSHIAQRQLEINAVAKSYGFVGVHSLNLPAGSLVNAPEKLLYQGVAKIVKQCTPSLLLLPHGGDPHSEHTLVNRAGWACSKSFRYPTIRQVWSYEVPSETDFAQPHLAFSPNHFVDISGYVDEKVRIMGTYTSEVKKHPFPRSELALRARATLHGVVTQTEAAEAFVILRSINRMGGP